MKNKYKLFFVASSRYVVLFTREWSMSYFQNNPWFILATLFCTSKCNIILYLLISLENSNYSRHCIKRPPEGISESGLLIKWSLNRNKFSIPGYMYCEFGLCQALTEMIIRVKYDLDSRHLQEYFLYFEKAHSIRMTILCLICIMAKDIVRTLINLK